MSNTPTSLTKKRVEALLYFAGRGEDELDVEQERYAETGDSNGL